MATRKAQPSWPHELYQPSITALKANFTEAEIRKEYSRLRDIAEKRLKRIASSEFKDSEAYRYNVDRFKPLKELTPKGGVNAALARSLADLERFISASTSTVSGLKHQRAATIQSLQAHGINYVNKSNFKDFYDFMNAAKANLNGRGYDSDAAASVWEWAQRNEINPEEIHKDFDYWYRNARKLDKVESKLGEGKHSAAEFRKALASRKK